MSEGINSYKPKSIEENSFNGHSALQKADQNANDGSITGLAKLTFFSHKDAKPAISQKHVTFDEKNISNSKLKTLISKIKDLFAKIERFFTGSPKKPHWQEGLSGDELKASGKLKKRKEYLKISVRTKFKLLFPDLQNSKGELQLSNAFRREFLKIINKKINPKNVEYYFGFKLAAETLQSAVYTKLYDIASRLENNDITVEDALKIFKNEIGEKVKTELDKMTAKDPEEDEDAWHIRLQWDSSTKRKRIEYMHYIWTKGINNDKKEEIKKITNQISNKYEKDIKKFFRQVTEG